MQKFVRVCFCRRRYGLGFPVVTAYVSVVGKTVRAMSCFEQKAGLRSLPILVILLWSYGASRGIRCICHAWRCSLGMQFYSCLPWWQQTVPQTLHGVIRTVERRFPCTFRVHAVCVFLPMYCVKGCLALCKAEGRSSFPWRVFHLGSEIKYRVGKSKVKWD